MKNGEVRIYNCLRYENIDSQPELKLMLAESMNTQQNASEALVTFCYYMFDLLF